MDTILHRNALQGRSKAILEMNPMNGSRLGHGLRKFEGTAGMQTDRQAELRKLWRAHFAEHDRIGRAFEAALDAGKVEHWQQPQYPPFPEVLRGLTCGARTRAGAPCKRKDLYRSGRCKFHGGMSTGPTSEEGKKRASQNACKSKAHEGATKLNFDGQ